MAAGNKLTAVIDSPVHSESGQWPLWAREPFSSTTASASDGKFMESSAISGGCNDLQMTVNGALRVS